MRNIRKVLSEASSWTNEMLNRRSTDSAVVKFEIGTAPSLRSTDVDRNVIH
ncbi:MAG: hypothetical protein ACTS6A_00430 [Candidatus Hodgkinia cicadicola]